MLRQRCVFDMAACRSCGELRRAVLALAILGQLLCCSGQGLSPASVARSPGPKSFDKVRSFSAEGEAWRNSYASSPENTCSKQTSSWCSAAPGSEEYLKLILACSPSSYDARKASTFFNPIGPVRDQRPCQTSVAFAVTSAAEAAVGSATQTNGSDSAMSQQDLQFCPDVQRNCYDNSDMKTALNRLTSGSVVAYNCLPYTAAQSDDPAKLCNYRCKNPPKAASQGKYGFSPLRDPIAAQKHIRRYGSFVTRFNLYSDFFDWIRKVASKDPNAVYSCPSSDKAPDEAQAVAVVGYDNKAGNWLVKNSWGVANGDKGYFRVKYGSCGVMTPGDTYGVYFIPKRQRQLPVTKLSSQDGSDGRQCYIYKARSDDFLSKIADSTVVNLGQLLLDNINVVRDIDKPLTGLRLRICDPDPASITVMSAKDKGKGGSPSSPVPPASPGIKPKPDVKPPDVKPPDVKPGNGTANATIEKAEKVDTKPLETAALLALKTSLGANQLKWEAGTDPCLGWTGVYCGPFGTPEQQRVYMIDLSSQGLSGSISNDIDLSPLEHLQALWLYGNQLNGKLPDSWSKLKAIQEINLYGNALTGSLPAEWSNMPSTLKRLYLNGNRLSGELPASWGGMKSLESLSLASNAFTGSVPASWSGMTGLKSISLYDNPTLSGCLPTDWQSRATKVELLGGPLSADGIPTLALSGTQVCGTCNDLECANSSSGSSNSTGSNNNSTGNGTPGNNSTGNGNAGGPGNGGGTPGGSGGPADGGDNSYEEKEPDVEDAAAADGGDAADPAQEAAPAAGKPAAGGTPGGGSSATVPDGATSGTGAPGPLLKTGSPTGTPGAATPTGGTGSGAPGSTGTPAAGSPGSSGSTPGSAAGATGMPAAGGGSSAIPAAGLPKPGGLGGSSSSSSTMGNPSARMNGGTPGSTTGMLPGDVASGTPVDPSLTVISEPSDRKANLQSIESSGVLAGAGVRARFRRRLAQWVCGDGLCTE